MASRPSPKAASPPGLVNSPFLPGSLSSTSSSPPQQPFGSAQKMTADGFGRSTSGYHLSPMAERSRLDRSPSSALSFGELKPTVSNPETDSMPTIIIRRLPRSANSEALRSMLLFAKDLVDVEFVSPEQLDDKTFATAIARFKTLAGAHEAKERLDGKANAANDAQMVVDILQNGIAGAFGLRRNTVDGTATRQGPVPTSSGIASNGHNTRQSSRFNGTFQSLERLSPPTGQSNGDFPGPDSTSHIHNVFSPQSPMNSAFATPSKSGKAMINEDAVDDETGDILKDPLAYAKSGQPDPASLTRRSTNPKLPVSRFAALSLNTSSGNSNSSMTSPAISAYATPRTGSHVQSPGSSMSNGGHTSLGGHGPTSNYQYAPQHFQRHNYPPVNPADQNPPCNTLYVGNLPIDTSEDELKAMFSKQRGYKRLCFRTKQNGPMCFVEFEDVSFATKALNELYGHPLHNSVKGGIRLSFSKNPLGVRTGQSSSMPQTPMTPQAVMPGMSGAIGAPPGFSTATGPPPGLSAPPGLAPSGLNINTGSGFGMYGNANFGMAHNGLGDPLRAQPMAAGMSTSVAGAPFAGMDGSYAPYMMGR